MKSEYNWYNDVGNGWHKLLDALYAMINSYPENSIEIFQIKEKFGGLRIYVDLVSDENGNYLVLDEKESEELYKFIDVLAEESYHICEYCGDIGELRKGGWMKTLCDKCEIIRREEQKLS